MTTIETDSVDLQKLLETIDGYSDTLGYDEKDVDLMKSIAERAFIIGKLHAQQ